MESETTAFLKVWSIIIVSFFYSYFISSNLPTAKLRLLSLLPVITLFVLLPLSLSSTLPTGITAFFITWLASFKLILHSFHLGPLSVSPPLSLPRFILAAAFPVKINTTSPHPKPDKVLPLNLGSETLIFSVLVVICDIYKDGFPEWVLFGVYCVMLYLFINIILGVSNLIVRSIASDVEVQAPSDEPYVATSLQDFWGRRWNLMVTDTLRHTVYFPTRVVLSNYTGKKRVATAVATTTSFLVSGLMHELIFYYMTRVSPTWEVTWFFVLHGLCVVLEVYLKKAVGSKVTLHWAVTGPLAVSFVIGTGFLWFFPPLVRNEVDVRAIEEAKGLYESIKAIFK